MTPYERPTEELRQVLHRDNTFDHAQFWYTAQRRWMVQDGPVYDNSNAPPSEVFSAHYAANTIHWMGGTMGQFCLLKTAWKELPCVTEEEVRQ